MQHSDSRGAAGRITVTLLELGGGVRVEVSDQGGATVPVLRAAELPWLAETGRGLFLVEALASRWGHQRDGNQVVTWFELADGDQ
jgi:anti-sigma regulatory factor (Ser/Thr protein kinase)